MLNTKEGKCQHAGRHTLKVTDALLVSNELDHSPVVKSPFLTINAAETKKIIIIIKKLPYLSRHLDNDQPVEVVENSKYLCTISTNSFESHDEVLWF